MSASNETAIQLVTDENVSTVLAEVQEAFFDIPFENSQFQTEAFVIAANVTPERAYRSIGLRMNAKIQAIMEAKKGRALEDIDIEDLEEKIAHQDTSDRDRRRAQIELNFKLASRPYTDKLMNDALVELNILYQHFRALPRYTREQFEAGERKHFDIKLDRQLAGIQGALEAQYNMAQDLPNLTTIEQSYSLSGNGGKTLLE